MANWPIQLRISGTTNADERSSIQLSALLDFDDGVTDDLSSAVNWFTESPYATVSANGLVTFTSITGNQAVTIRCSYNHPDAGYMAANHVVFVRDVDVPLVLYSIQVSGENRVDKNSAGKYLVTAFYTNGTSAIITPTTFVSNRPTLATIDRDGQARFLNIRGTSQVRFTATFILNGVTRQSSMDIVIEDNSIYPVTATLHGHDVLPEGTCGNYKMMVTFEDNSRQQVIPTWSVEGPATISSTGDLKVGYVEGVANATLVGSYKFEDVVVAAEKNISVIDASLSIINISLEGPAVIREGLSANYTAALHFSDGSSVPISSSISSESTAVVITDNVVNALPIDAQEDVLLSTTFREYMASKLIQVVPSPAAVSYIEIIAPDEVDSNSHTQIKIRAVFEDESVAIVHGNLSVSLPGCTILDGVLHTSEVAETIGIEISATYHMHGTFTARKIVMLKGRNPAVKKFWIEFPDKVTSPTPVTCKVEFDDGVISEVDAFVALPTGEQIHLFMPSEPTLLTAIYKTSIAHKEVSP